MKDYYKILLINNSATKQEIIEAYNNNIKQFNNLPFLTEEMKVIIKELKEAKYVLTDDERRRRYDNMLNSEVIDETINESVEQPIEQPIEQPVEQPIEHNIYLNHPIIPKMEQENQFDNTQICNRIFSIKRF